MGNHLLDRLFHRFGIRALTAVDRAPRPAVKMTHKMVTGPLPRAPYAGYFV
jgi:hypothetical protein